jgi:hypothetical protein
MPYTSAATACLAAYAKPVAYTLELCRGRPTADGWSAVPLADFTLTHEAGRPAVLRASVPNLPHGRPGGGDYSGPGDAGAAGSSSGLRYSDELDPANPLVLGATARLACSIGGEDEVLFYGRVFSVTPQDGEVELVAHDPLALLGEVECDVALAPAETAELPLRPLGLLADGALGSLWGFGYAGGGDDAFNQDAAPGTRRRSWVPGDIRLWYDADATLEVPPQHWQASLASGCVALLEDPAGRSYFASGVRCYVEGSLDWADVFAAALAHPAEQGGLGAGPAELDLPPLGLTPAGPVDFRGRAADFVQAVLQRQQANLRLYYDPRAAVPGSPGTPGKYALRLVAQAAAPNWTLLHPQSIAQPRDLADLFSRVVVTGSAERPLNALAQPGATIVGDASAGDWFAWDGLAVGPDAAAADVLARLYDGDAGQGAGVHNLAPAADVAPGATRYHGWYRFVSCDLGSLQRIGRVRCVMPPSRNSNAAAGHQGLFWPGLRVEVSGDGSDWRLLSARLCGRFAPLALVEAAGADLLLPRARYLRVLCGAYKHGFDNHADPGIGLLELEVYTAEDYRVVRAIDGAAAPATYYSYSDDYDGDGALDRWQRNRPALWRRLGGDPDGGAGRHRTRFVDMAGQLGAAQAADYALELLSEGVRLFQQVRYTAVCDPRVRLYDTAVAHDDLNGYGGGPRLFLVERVVLRPDGTEVSGTDYSGE